MTLLANTSTYRHAPTGKAPRQHLIIPTTCMHKHPFTQKTESPSSPLPSFQQRQHTNKKLTNELSPDDHDCAGNPDLTGRLLLLVVPDKSVCSVSNPCRTCSKSARSSGPAPRSPAAPAPAAASALPPPPAALSLPSPLAPPPRPSIVFQRVRVACGVCPPPPPPPPPLLPRFSSIHQTICAPTPPHLRRSKEACRGPVRRGSAADLPSTDEGGVSVSDELWHQNRMTTTTNNSNTTKRLPSPP